MTIVECKINGDVFNVDLADHKILMGGSVPLIFSYLGDSVLEMSRTEFQIYSEYPEPEDPLEHQLFTWSCCDDLGDDVFRFAICKLTIPIGSFKIGDEIPSILIDCRHSKLHMFDNAGNSIYTTKLKLSVA